MKFNSHFAAIPTIVWIDNVSQWIEREKGKIEKEENWSQIDLKAFKMKVHTTFEIWLENDTIGPKFKLVLTKATLLVPAFEWSFTQKNIGSYMHMPWSYADAFRLV